MVIILELRNPREVEVSKRCINTILSLRKTIIQQKPTHRHLTPIYASFYTGGIT